MDSSVPEPSQSNPSRQPLSEFNDNPSRQQQQVMQQAYHGSEKESRHDGLTKALGWFSVGLGIAQIVAPRTISRLAGLGHSPILVRAVGLREIASGVGILSDRNPSGWLWTRVAGDAMDLALLGNAARASGI
ncbi:MAG: hypothetical protein ACXU7H_08125, partial [Burkholderiaceae bacterium]